MFILIFIIKSEFFSVWCFKPYPSEPNKRTWLSFQSWLVKSLLDLLSNPHIQKFLVFKYFNVVLIFDTSNMFIWSIQPLALLYSSLLSLGKDLSLTINPSILNDTALLIIEPMFLGSVTSSRTANVTLLFSSTEFK